jgi:hypothetical protein
MDTQSTKKGRGGARANAGGKRVGAGRKSRSHPTVGRKFTISTDLDQWLNEFPNRSEYLDTILRKAFIESKKIIAD